MAYKLQFLLENTNFRVQFHCDAGRNDVVVVNRQRGEEVQCSVHKGTTLKTKLVCVLHTGQNYYDKKYRGKCNQFFGGERGR